MIARPLLPDVASLGQLIEKYLHFLDGRIARGKTSHGSWIYYEAANCVTGWMRSAISRLEQIRAFHLVGDGAATPHRIQSAKRLFKWAAKAGVIEADPMANVDQPPFGKRKRVLERTEAARLLLGADRIGKHSRRQRPAIGVCNLCGHKKPDVLAIIMRLPKSNSFGGDRQSCRDCRQAHKGHWRYPSKPCRRWRSAAARPLRWMLVALARTIARPGELRRVRWRDYAEQAGTFTLTKFKAKDRRGDGVEVRVIIVDERLRRLLERWRQRRKPAPDDRIFLNRSGRPWSTNALCRAVRVARQRAGLVADSDGEKVVAYTRATHPRLAQRSLDPDVPPATLYELSKAMGHANTRTTERYAHHDSGRPETIAAATASCPSESRPNRKTNLAPRSPPCADIAVSAALIAANGYQL